MNYSLTIQLSTTPEQHARIQALQAAFAEACNAITPIVRETRCWNRVALHHMAYRQLREKFPQIGSQMACNAIYSVSRMCRMIFQAPASPWNIAKLGDRDLPTLQFAPSAPVYFDRHTLSLKNGRLSMYTLDGRMHFDLDLDAASEARFHQEKLREIVLTSSPQGAALSFHFSSEAEGDGDAPLPDTVAAELPEYLLVITPPEPFPVPALDLARIHAAIPAAA
jgi:hypothetical protein